MNRAINRNLQILTNCRLRKLVKSLFQVRDYSKNIPEGIIQIMSLTKET